MTTVSATPITGTKEVLLQAWELEAGHSTIQSHPDGYWVGKVGTSPLPADIEALVPGSTERIAAVEAFIAADKDRAFAIICDHEAHAEAHGRRDGAQVYIAAEDLA